MNKRSLKIAGFAALLFIAGAASGFFLAKNPGPPPPGGMERRLPFEEEVSLTPEQRQKIGEIWNNLFAKSLRPHHMVKRGLEKELQQKIVALIGNDKKEEYESLRQEYRQKQEEMDQIRQDFFNKAVEETKAILSPEQLEKYEEFLKRGRSRFGGPGQRDGSRRSRGERNGMGPDNNFDGPPPPPDAQPENAPESPEKVEPEQE